MHIFDRGSQGYILNPETGLRERNYHGYEGHVAQPRPPEGIPMAARGLFEPEAAHKNPTRVL